MGYEGTEHGELTQPGSLTRLAYEEANVIPEHGRVPVQKIASKFHHHGEFGKFLQDLSRLKPTRTGTQVSPSTTAGTAAAGILETTVGEGP